MTAPQVARNLIDLGRSLEPVTVAGCHPCSEVPLRRAVEAAQAQMIKPVRACPSAKIRAIAAQGGLDITPYRLVASAQRQESAEKSLALRRAGECEALMKGSLHTREMMHEVISATTWCWFFCLVHTDI